MLIPCVRFILGFLIVLFFKCMAALLDPVNRKRERIKLWLVVYTVAMFSIVTVQIAIDLHIQSIGYIDNREFPGIEEAQLPPGPMGYQIFISRKVLPILSRVTFFLNAWLADGLLVSSLLDVAFTHPGA